MLNVISGAAVPQVSFLVQKDGVEQSTCSVKFTNSDWQSVYNVSVKATADQLYDGNQELNQTIMVDYIDANNVDESLYQSVKVKNKGYVKI